MKVYLESRQKITITDDAPAVKNVTFCKNYVLSYEVFVKFCKKFNLLFFLIEQKTRLLFFQNFYPVV